MQSIQGPSLTGRSFCSFAVLVVLGRTARCERVAGGLQREGLLVKKLVRTSARPVPFVHVSDVQDTLPSNRASRLEMSEAREKFLVEPQTSTT